MSIKNNTKVSILIITDAWTPQVNGVVRTYQYINKELEARGYEVNVIGPHDFPIRLKTPGYSEIELALFTRKKLRNLIESFTPDIIHLATEGPLGRAGKKYCDKRSLAYTTCYHTQFPDYIAKRVARALPFMFSPVKKFAIKSVKKFHHKSKAVMVATKTLEQQLKDWQFTPPLEHLTRGINRENFFLAEEKTNLFEGLEQPIALYVGRVAIEKNIEAFLNMKWDGTKVVVGDGPRLAEFKKSYPHIHFAGKKTGKELGAHYQNSDLFVFPSKTDTFGMVLIEALACGLPVAAYDVMGPRDIITEDFLGALHENDLSEAAQQAMAYKKTQKNTDRIEKKRSDYVKENYSWVKATDQFLDIIIKTKNTKT